MAFIRNIHSGEPRELAFNGAREFLDNLLVDSLETCDDVLWHTRYVLNGSDSIEVILIHDCITTSEHVIGGLDGEQSYELDQMIRSFAALVK